MSAEQQENQRDFISRELSWLDFNSRVLDEAGFVANKLLERLKFIAIFSSNLDEFFMVRIAGLRQLVQTGANRPDPAGNRPERQLGQRPGTSLYPGHSEGPAGPGLHR